MYVFSSIQKLPRGQSWVQREKKHFFHLLKDPYTVLRRNIPHTHVTSPSHRASINIKHFHFTHDYFHHTSFIFLSTCTATLKIKTYILPLI